MRSTIRIGKNTKVFDEGGELKDAYAGSICSAYWRYDSDKGFYLWGDWFTAHPVGEFSMFPYYTTDIKNFWTLPVTLNHKEE